MDYASTWKKALICSVAEKLYRCCSPTIVHVARSLGTLLASKSYPPPTATTGPEWTHLVGAHCLCLTERRDLYSLFIVSRHTSWSLDLFPHRTQHPAWKPTMGEQESSVLVPLDSEIQSTHDT